ncbi:dual specificity protein phosphatase 15 isoform X2 [Mus musculus]|nr:dual specificity protein phosphatase 15 isoform X2 [Mus musculus]|eukprot:XP_011237862.1 PREDICTED: dual specificity protein phosphatase 15 isoform X2 [Mus musculus]
MPKTRISWAGIRSHISSLSTNHPSLCCRISPTFESQCLILLRYPSKSTSKNASTLSTPAASTGVTALCTAWGCPGSSFAGISRSTTIVIAYVMTVTGLGWQEVLEAIKASRPIANPNPGFRQQLEEFGWANSQKLRRQLEERFGEIPFRDEEDLRALLPLCRRCRQGSATSAASATTASSAAEGTLQRLVPRSPRDSHQPLPLLARVKQTFFCLPRCLSRKGGK